MLAMTIAVSKGGQMKENARNLMLVGLRITATYRSDDARRSRGCMLDWLRHTCCKGPPSAISLVGATRQVRNFCLRATLSNRETNTSL
jgi:hypothetical protein